MAWLSNILKKTFNLEAPPNQVIDVKTDKYDNRPIICREEGMFLYAGSGDLKYDIVMHKPFSQSLSDGYSLFRSPERDLAEEKFINLKDKLPTLVNIFGTNTSVNVIQKWCNILELNPSWNVCHVVAFLNLIDAISVPSVLSLINSSCPLTGLSPLQVAAKEANVAMMQKLIDNHADLSHLDHCANSVYHFAAITNKEVILMLTTNDADLRGLNQRNVTGYTPLHLACQADKPDCVIALISNGADVNISAGSPSSAPPANMPVGMMADVLTDARKQFLVEGEAVTTLLAFIRKLTKWDEADNEGVVEGTLVAFYKNAVKKWKKQHSNENESFHSTSNLVLRRKKGGVSEL